MELRLIFSRNLIGFLKQRFFSWVSILQLGCDVFNLFFAHVVRIGREKAGAQISFFDSSTCSCWADFILNLCFFYPGLGS